MFDCDILDLKLLVSCYSEIRYIDLSQYKAKIFFQGRKNQQYFNGKKQLAHWGLTWDHDYIFAYHAFPYNNEDLTHQIARLDFNGNLLDYLPIDIPFTQVHQLHCQGDFLWVVDTGHNLVHKINLKTYEHDTIVPDPSLDLTKDIIHLNAVWVKDDIVYIGSHQGIVFCYNINTNKQICKHRYDPDMHNIFILDNHLCTHMSAKGKIVDNNKHTFLKTKPYSRGIVITDEYILVGISPVAIRDRRSGNLDGSIVIYDRKQNNKMIGKIIIPNAGQIIEIRCTNKKDYAHNEIIIDGEKNGTNRV